MTGTSDDEECDIANSNGQPNSACTAECKTKWTTLPGENPITDLWMTIPTLSNTRLGYSWLDGTLGKIRFEDNRMVLGNGTHAFTRADII